MTESATKKKTTRPTETSNAWMHRTHRSGEFNFTSLISFTDDVTAHWEGTNREGQKLPLLARLKGYETGKGVLPRTSKHPVTKAKFVFPLFKFDLDDDGLYNATLINPSCPECGAEMKRTAATESRPSAFACYPCKVLTEAFDDVTGDGKQKDEKKTKKTKKDDDRDTQLRDHKATVARILSIITLARKVVEDQGLSLPIGVRTSEHLAKLAVVLGDADEAWRLWIDGRVPSQWREKFDAAGLPKGKFRPMRNEDANDPTWYATVAKVLDAGMPVMVVGPAGSGKTYFAKWYARRVQKDIEIVVGSGDLAGSQLWVDQVSAKGGNTTVHRGPATRACTDGNVLLLDEVDGFDPNSLLPMNAVLNGDRQLSVPVLGNLDISEEVRIIACANTTGLTRDRTYTARNKLDGAFLNRFAVVVHAGYEIKVDQKVAENAILAAIKALG